MKMFFTDLEREQLIEDFRSSTYDFVTGLIEEDVIQEKLVSLQMADYLHGLHWFDIRMGTLKRSELEAFSGSTREKLLQLLSGWSTTTQSGFYSAADHLVEQIQSGTHELEETVETAINDLCSAREFLALARRFPLMFSTTQKQDILHSGKTLLDTLRPQYETLRDLTPDDIAAGNLDFNNLGSSIRFHSPFLPTILTLLDIKDTPLPAGYAYVPIVNDEFPDNDSFYFKGVVQTIPRDIYDDLCRVDPSVFELLSVGENTMNGLVYCLMASPGGEGEAFTEEDKNNALREWIRLLDKGEISITSSVTVLNTITNIGEMIDDSQLASLDFSEIGQWMLKPEKPMKDALARLAEKSYINLSPSKMGEAAEELSDTGWLVKLRYFEKEWRANPVNKEREDVFVTMFDPFSPQYVRFDPFQKFYELEQADVHHILRKGPRIMSRGGRFFSRNKEFFKRWKENPSALDPDYVYAIMQKISQRITDKSLQERIEILTNCREARSTSPPPDVIMHYLSKCSPQQVLVEALNELKEGDHLLGYAMHNCLSVMDLYRWSQNPNATVSCFWMNGERVGMGFELEVAYMNQNFFPLVDSFEFGDEFYSMMEKISDYDGECPEHYHARCFIHSYLEIQLQRSESGIFILPESNDLRVRDALLDFVEIKEGKPILDYSGMKVYTDTRFESAPFFIEK